MPDLHEDIPITIESEIFKKTLEYCVMHGYNPVPVNQPIKTNDLKQILHPLDYQFISNYDLDNIKPLLSSAIYLNIKPLIDVCIAWIACEFYFPQTLEGLQEFKNKFNVKDSDLDENTTNYLKEEYSWAFRTPHSFIYNKWEIYKHIYSFFNQSHFHLFAFALLHFPRTNALTYYEAQYIDRNYCNEHPAQKLAMSYCMEHLNTIH